jgi:hypothetical protein
MRAETKKKYEARIVALEELLTKSEERVGYHRNRANSWHSSWEHLRMERVQGVEARQWAVEQALRMGRADVTTAAKQIADYVYGTDTDADRPAENPT